MPSVARAMPRFGGKRFRQDLLEFRHERPLNLILHARARAILAAKWINREQDQKDAIGTLRQFAA
jgi:hypothetical protein